MAFSKLTLKLVGFIFIYFFIVDFKYLFSIIFIQGVKSLVLASNDTRFGSLPLKFLNDLDIDGNVIYFVDTSFLRGVDEVLTEFADGQPRGRFFKFDQSTNQINLLLDNLYFPNGITLTPKKDAVLINEMTTTRILKYLF